MFGQISGTAPTLFFRETDQTLPNGLWRLKLEGNQLRVEKNTAMSGNFSTTTITTIISASSINPGTSGGQDLGGTSLPFANAFLSTSLIIGATPATGGTIRVPSGGSIVARNYANDGNITLITKDDNSTDTVTLGTTVTNNIRVRVGSAGTIKLVADEDTGKVWIAGTGNFRIDPAFIQFGGTTGSFPAIKRSTTELQVRLADDSADASLKAASLTATASIVLPSTATLSSGGTDITSLERGTNLQTFRVHGGGSSSRYIYFVADGANNATVGNNSDGALNFVTNGSSGGWRVNSSGSGYSFSPGQADTDLGSQFFPVRTGFINAVNYPLTAPSSPNDGDSWIECTGTTPTRNCSLKVRDTGSTRNIVTSSNF